MKYDALRCPGCRSTNIRQRKDGLVCCYKCGKQCQHEKLTRLEEPKTFRCGHDRTPENTIKYHTNKICKTCKQARSRAWHNPKNPKLPIYPTKPCALAEVWK